MKRAVVTLGSAFLFVIAGCSAAYDARLANTLDEMRYRKRLDDNLMPPATKGKLEELQIFFRPPKLLKGPTQTFAWTVVEPGRFDLEQSFIDEAKSESAHILVRVKKPKAPANTKKKTAAPAQEAVPRGEFTADIVEMVKNVYGDDLATKKFKAEVRSHGNRSNTFKTLTLDLSTKEIQLYLFGDKNGPYEIALIFDYPKESKSSIETKIRLALEAFATGEAARRAFTSGNESEGSEGGGEAPPPI